MFTILRRFYPYLSQFKLFFFFVFLGIIMTVVANIAMAYIMQPMMDQLFIEKQKEMLVVVPLMMIAIYFIKGFGRYIQSVFTTYIGQRVVTRFRSLLLEKLLYIDTKYITQARSGEMISRITNDIARIQYFVSLMLPEFIRELVTVIALIGYVLYLNTHLAIYALIVLPIVIFPISYISRKLRKISFGSQEKNGDLLAKLSEIFNNVEVVKTAAAESYELKKFSIQNWEFFKLNMKAVYLNQIASPVLEVVGALSLAIVIYLGAQEVYADKMSVGEFMSFLTAIGLVFQPARGLGIIYTKMQDALAASYRVFELLDTQNEIIGGRYKLDSIKTVEFVDVSLNYDEKKALQQINFYVEKPHALALVGESGGGKSSIVNLLVRSYDVSSGKVLINGRDIKEYTLESLRNNIAMVSQNTYIFNDTIAANVAYGSSIDNAKVIEALKLANAYEFVQQFPDGIETKLDENGSNLSGGQKQRIALARALYKDADLLILDEATSALDNESEAKIIQSIEQIAQDKIVIAIAHRLTTVKNYDTILVLQDGVLVDSGTHKKLLTSSPVYAQLYNKSLKG